MGLLAALGLAPRHAAPEVAGGPGTPGRVVARAGPRRPRPVRVADVDDHGYGDASKPVQQGLDELKRHPQHARVKERIDEIASLLAQGRAEALKGKVSAATTLLQQASNKLGSAKNLANYFIEYVRARLRLEAMTQGLRTDDPAFERSMADEFKRVDKIAYATPPNPLDGIAALNATIRRFKPALQKSMDDLKAARAALQAKKPTLRRFAEADLKQIDDLIGQMERAAASETWGLAMMARLRAWSILAPTGHMMERREAFEAERQTTSDVVARVKAVTGMATRAAALQALLGQADKLATPQEMGFDAAMRLLQQARQRGGTWLSISTWVATYDKLHADALRDAALLAKDPAAKPLAPQLAAIDKLLRAAAAAVAAAEAGGDLVAGFLTGSNAAVRASGELRRVKGLVQGMGPVLQARALAKDPSDLTGLKNSLAVLRAEADKAGKEAFAAEAVGELRRFGTAAGQAEAALRASDGKTALARLGEAAQRLAGARRIQVQRGQFDAELAEIERRRKTLDGLATAALLKGKIARVDAALAEARVKIKGLDGTAAFAALQRAEEAAGDVTQADTERRRFDAEARAVDGLIKGVADAKFRTELAAHAKSAVQQADAFRFDAAGKSLAAIKVRIDEATVRSLSASKPDDPALAAAAVRMMDNGGAATLEKLIAGFPEKGSAKAMVAIAKARHGLEFVLDSAAPQPGDIKALKAISHELTKLPPQDAKNDPSLRRISRDQSTSDDDRYDARSATIHLVSATDNPNKQRFGADLKVYGTNKPQLPPIEREYQPTNTAPVERLNWATLHEVGHGLDDRHRFMSRHEEDKKYGNWKTYGTAVKPIADAVATYYGFNTTAEQRQYVLDLITNTPTQPPPEPKANLGGLTWEDLRTEIENWRALAARPQVYMDQGACASLTINDTIYQEAYPRVWVSYPASERSKGLTGYQFRAPGEWFAELYAGYRSGKLGPRHPALEWLKKIAP